MKKIETYMSKFDSDQMSEAQKRKVAILLWKALPSKAEFAQDFSIHLIENLKDARTTFLVPKYIVEALNHLKGGL